MGELAIEQKHWTVEDLDRLPYDEWNRYEIIDGELLVTSAPHGDHQQTAFRIAQRSDNWSEETGIGEVYEAAGVIFTIDNSVQPDVLWVSDERKARLYDEAGHFTGAPELVVEILSSGTQNEKRDRETKRRAYEKYGGRGVSDRGLAVAAVVCLSPGAGGIAPGKYAIRRRYTNFAAPTGVYLPIGANFQSLICRWRLI